MGYKWSISAEQHHLLRATLCKGQQVESAWQQWREMTDFEQLDLASYRLLPMLYRNLQANQIEDALLPRLSGVYKRIWLENQLLLTAFKPVLQLLLAEGVQATLIGEAASVYGVFGKGQIRPISSITLAISTQQRRQSKVLLTNTGWQRRTMLRRWVHTITRQSSYFTNQAGNTLRLIWKTTQYAKNKALDDTVHIPTPAAQLKHIMQDRGSYRPVNQAVLLADIFHLAQQTSLQPFQDNYAVCTLHTLLKHKDFG